MKIIETKSSFLKGEEILRRYLFVLMIFAVVILFFQKVPAREQTWGNDVLVHSADFIYGFGMDQGDKDTLYLVVSDSSTTNSTDTTYIYCSTDNGRSWVLKSWTDGGRKGKVDIIVARGVLNAVYIYEINNKRLVCSRYSYVPTTVQLSTYISDTGDSVVDFEVCQDLSEQYGLYVVYQTEHDSVIFKHSIDFDSTWTDEANLTSLSPIFRQPCIAWSRGAYIVVAGQTSNDQIYTIRNTDYGNPSNWQNGQYASGSDSLCTLPALAGSHTLPDSQAVFWLFYSHWFSTTSHDGRMVLKYRYSTNAGYTWSTISGIQDTTGIWHQEYPSLHILKENNASNLSLSYVLTEKGGAGNYICYIYKENAQDSPSSWPHPYFGWEHYWQNYDRAPRIYTIREKDNSIGSVILYLGKGESDLYFNASSFTSVDDDVESEIPEGFYLKQNFPNPFNPGTKIAFILSKPGQVKVDIFNVLGQKVRTLVQRYLKAGYHQVEWNGRDDSGKEIASGIYFYRLQTNNFDGIKKMVLMR
jgi:hypothetical protein